MLLDEQERVLNFLKAALNEDSAAVWSFLSSLFESDLFGADGEGMSSRDSKLRLYSFFLPNLLLLVLVSLDLRIPRKPTGGSGGETLGVSGDTETGETEETLEQGEDISLADWSSPESVETSEEEEEEEEESLEAASTLGVGDDVDSFGTDNLGDETETLGEREGLVEDVEETLELRVVG